MHHLKQRYQRRNLDRYVVIVDSECRVVAREQSTTLSFADFRVDKLPDEVVALVRGARTSERVHVLADGFLLHVIPITGSREPLRALVFEEVRIRTRAHRGTVEDGAPKRAKGEAINRGG